MLSLRSDAALDILWRRQITLGPLIQVMPVNLWVIRQPGDEEDSEDELGGAYVVSQRFIITK